MDVENPELAVTRVPKAVEHSDRNRYPGSMVPLGYGRFVMPISVARMTSSSRMCIL